ncbi:MAG: hypothetical protein QOD99_995 [Chthoniobacter sp.]|jgi:hypothetical protein|nr:hypothetical protein [Chthoniobacter sp.]
MIALIRKLFWLALFVVFTFCFVVLFDHGTQNFTENAQLEIQELQKTFGKINRPKDASEKIGQ